MPSERTITSIRLQGEPLKTPGYLIWDCGCMDRGAGRWLLCQYHNGFDDASERADQLQALIDNFAAGHRGFMGEYLAAHDALLAAATKEDDRG